MLENSDILQQKQAVDFCVLGLDLSYRLKIWAETPEIWFWILSALRSFFPRLAARRGKILNFWKRKFWVNAWGIPVKNKVDNR